MRALLYIVLSTTILILTSIHLVCIFSESLDKVQRKSVHYEHNGDVQSTDVEADRAIQSPVRFIQESFLKRRRSNEPMQALTNSLELPDLPAASPKKHRSSLAESIPASVEPSASARILLNHNTDFIGSTSKLDEGVRKKGLVPGTTAATYFLVSQLFRRVITLEQEFKNWKFVSQENVFNESQRTFSVPVLKKLDEIDPLVSKMEDHTFRRDLVSFFYFFYPFLT